MNPEEKALLERVVALSEENNRILEKMRKSGRINNIFRVCYWILIIGLSFGAFYFVQPYIDSLQSSLSSFGGGTSAAASASTGNNTPSAEAQAQQLNALLKKL